MLLSFILKSSVYSKTITIKNVEYGKSEILKKTENILFVIRLVVSSFMVILSYILVKNGTINFGSAENGAFIIMQSVLGYLVTVPFFFLFLPHPISNHLTELVCPSEQV